MKKRKLQFDFWTVVTIGIIAVFALFLIYPLISLFIDGFLKEGTGEFTLANFQKFFGKKFYYRSLLNSLTALSRWSISRSSLANPIT